MFLLDWYKEWIEIRYEKLARRKELEFCGACETLKMQLAEANSERRILIEKLTNVNVKEESKVDYSQLKPIMPKVANWNVRRQALEAEDRAAAKLLKQNQEANKMNGTGGSGKPLTVTEIEKELGVDNG